MMRRLDKQKSVPLLPQPPTVISAGDKLTFLDSFCFCFAFSSQSKSPMTHNFAWQEMPHINSGGTVCESAR